MDFHREIQRLSPNVNNANHWIFEMGGSYRVSNSNALEFDLPYPGFIDKLTVVTSGAQESGRNV